MFYNLARFSGHGKESFSFPFQLTSELSILDGHSSNIASMNSELRDSMARMMTEMMTKMRDDMLKDFEAYVAGSEASNDCDDQVDQPHESQETDAMADYFQDANSETLWVRLRSSLLNFPLQIKQAQQLMIS